MSKKTPKYQGQGPGRLTYSIGESPREIQRLEKLENKKQQWSPNGQKIPHWVTAASLMEEWNVNTVSLATFVAKFDLPAYDSDDLNRIEPEYREAKIYIDQHNSVFNLEDIERFEQEHPEVLGAKAAKEYPTNEQKTIFPCEPGTKWEDVTITLVANDTVRIKTPQGEGRFSYHELGMSDKRSSGKNTALWALLKFFAKNGGFISSQNPNYDRDLPDTTKRLNSHLKKLFGIEESIYTGHYKKVKGYKTRISFRDRTF